MRDRVCADKFRNFSFFSQKIRDKDGAGVDTGLFLPAFWLGVGAGLLAVGDEPPEIGKGGF